MKAICLKGWVFSGMGEGEKYVGLAWVKEQIEQKLGFAPYAGTLNIRLDDESKLKKNLLIKGSSFEMVPSAGHCGGRLYKAILNGGAEAAVVVPEVPDYPENVVEVVSSENLRKKLMLKDGDAVDVRIIL
jgi:riboflavin kinase